MTWTRFLERQLRDGHVVLNVHKNRRYGQNKSRCACLNILTDILENRVANELFMDKKLLHYFLLPSQR